MIGTPETIKERKDDRNKDGWWSDSLKKAQTRKGRLTGVIIINMNLNANQNEFILFILLVTWTQTGIIFFIRNLKQNKIEKDEFCFIIYQELELKSK